MSQIMKQGGRLTAGGSKFFDEFKNFAFKGNMIELAVAVVIGTAFGKVMAALVERVVMPLISYVPMAQGDYRSWKLGKVEIGIFISELLNFLIIAFAVFLVIVKVVGFLTRKKNQAPPPPPAPTREEVLLTEIRDLLRDGRTNRGSAPGTGSVHDGP
jgi:large conductance mechanosensitive channel